MRKEGGVCDCLRDREGVVSFEDLHLSASVCRSQYIWVCVYIRPCVCPTGALGCLCSETELCVSTIQGGEGGTIGELKLVQNSPAFDWHVRERALLVMRLILVSLGLVISYRSTPLSR